jgi:hypothetical protein
LAAKPFKEWTMREKIEVGFHAFVAGDCEEFGAVREVFSNGMIVYVENAGDFMVPFAVVEAVHSQKVIFMRAQLDPRIQQAILRAHDAEVPGV